MKNKNTNTKLFLAALAVGVIVYLLTVAPNQRPVTHLVRPSYERTAKP